MLSSARRTRYNQRQKQSLNGFIKVNLFLSVNFIGGSSKTNRTESNTHLDTEEDQDVFEFLTSNLRHKPSTKCEENSVVYNKVDRISNFGTMFHFNYLLFGIPEIVLEISCCNKKYF